jgi:hypothetical protein
MALKLENPKWSGNPELALIDTALEKHPELINNFALKDEVVVLP